MHVEVLLRVHFDSRAGLTSIVPGFRSPLSQTDTPPAGHTSKYVGIIRKAEEGPANSTSAEEVMMNSSNASLLNYFFIPTPKPLRRQPAQKSLDATYLMSANWAFKNRRPNGNPSHPKR